MDSRADGQLLADVAASQSQEAFEDLVRRHGDMVLNACLRLLSDRHEAEDVTQAVFLVLWAKAKSLRHRSTVAPWLHRVAKNICRNTWRSNMARKTKERSAMEVMQRDSADDVQWNEIKDVLDDELDRLPEKYRLPLILFHLEGRQIEDIARLTNSKTATVASQLRRARELLRSRMARRGITAGTGALLAAVDLHANAANLSASFVASTAQHAVAFSAGSLVSAGSAASQSVHLAQGALKMLAVAKFKLVATAIASAVLAVGLLGAATFTLLPASDQVTGAAAEQKSAANQVEVDGKTLTLQTIIETLEKQRDQIQSLDIETKFYIKTLVDPKVLRSWKRFGEFDLTSRHSIQLSYKGGKRYQRWVSTRETPPVNGNGPPTRRVTFHDEKGSDGMSVWERRVDLDHGPAQVFVLPVEPNQQWVTNPTYCSNFGWDCRSELHIHDKETLERQREFDFLSLLKKGEYTLDAAIQDLDGARCAVLRRNYKTQIIEDDADRERPRFAKATDTVWLDVDHGFAMRQHDRRNDVWGLDRTTNSDFVAILPGVWFPQKTRTEPYAPLDAPKEYQGRPVLSWNDDLVRWSVNDVPDSRFDRATKPSDLLYVRGETAKVIDDQNQLVDPAVEANKSPVTSTPAAEVLTPGEKEFIEALTNAATSPKKELRVAIASGPGCDPATHFLQLLKSHANCEIVPLTQMRKPDAVKECDVLIVPGGQSSEQAKALGEAGRRTVREFVEAGGGYVGVCAGACLVTTNLDGGLGLLNAEILNETKKTPGPDGEMTVHLKQRGSGIIKTELTEAGRKVLDAPAGLTNAAFLAGMVLRPTNRDDLPKPVCLSRCRTEVWLHKLQIGTMVDTPNVLAAPFGKGRVIVFSTHPEVRPETESMLVRAVLAVAHQPADPN